MANTCYNALVFKAPADKSAQIYGFLDKYISKCERGTSPDLGNMIAHPNGFTIIRFETRWDPDRYVAKAVSKEFGDISFDYFWLESGCGLCGKTTFFNGLITPGYKDKFSYRGNIDIADNRVIWAILMADGYGVSWEERLNENTELKVKVSPEWPFFANIRVVTFEKQKTDYGEMYLGRELLCFPMVDIDNYDGTDKYKNLINKIRADYKEEKKVG